MKDWPTAVEYGQPDFGTSRWVVRLARPRPPKDITETHG
jgi:hypothetical protein